MGDDLVGVVVDDLGKRGDDLATQVKRAGLQSLAQLLGKLLSCNHIVQPAKLSKQLPWQAIAVIATPAFIHQSHIFLLSYPLLFFLAPLLKQQSSHKEK